MIFLLLYFKETENLTLEANIRWADAFILMYSVADKCSFDECNRLKFLINYNKRRRKLGSNNKVRTFNRENFFEYICKYNILLSQVE